MAIRLILGNSESSDEKSRRPLMGKRKRKIGIDEDDNMPITPQTRRCRKSIRERHSGDSLSAKDRNLRRLESNERERLRMHSLNDAFEVFYILLMCTVKIILQLFLFYIHDLLVLSAK